MDHFIFKVGIIMQKAIENDVNNGSFDYSQGLVIDGSSGSIRFQLAMIRFLQQT